MLVFLLMNAIVLGSAALLTFKVLRLNSFIDSVIAFFILFFSQIVLTQELLGISNLLYLKYLIAFNAVILLIIWILTRGKSAVIPIDGLKNTFTDLFSKKTVLLIASIILAFGIVKVSINLFNPPFGWDCLNYHFTYPVEWIKNGNLINPPTTFGDPSPPYYPMNGSLFFLWFIFPFKNAMVADLGQIPFFLISILAVYRISRQIGLNKEYSFYASTLFLLIPNYFKQLEIAYVDAMVAALFLVCLHFILLLHNNFSLKKVFLFSASLGLFLGVKTVALPYSVLLFIPFGCILIKNFKKIPGAVIILLLSLVGLGGFTYIRNFIHTNNPLYPLDFKILGKTIFNGVMNKETYGAHFTSKDYSLSKLLFHEGLSGQGFLFMFVQMFIALPLSFVKKRRQVNFLTAYILILPILIYLIYRFVVPLANTRYLYSLFGLGMAISFYVFNVLNLPKTAVRILTGLCALASMSTLGSHAELGAGIGSSLTLFALILFLRNRIKISFRIKYLVVLSVLLIFGLGFLNKYYNSNIFSNYIKMEEYSGFWPDATRAWEWLEHNTKSDNIAYVGRPVGYPLYGTNFKNNVYYVSVNKTEPAILHQYPGSYYTWGYDFLSLHEMMLKDNNCRGNADYQVWLSHLRLKEINYLFVYSLQQTKGIHFSIEDEWAKQNQNIFEPVFSNKTIHIYKVKL